MPCGQPVRNRILDVASELLREGNADFSMRDLAARGEVSFATPFNHFGSKAAIMYALAARLVESMVRRQAASAPVGGAVDRVLDAIGIGAAVMLDEPGVNRTIMGSLGSATGTAGEAMAQSQALWEAPSAMAAA